MSGDQLINSIIYRDWMQCQLVHSQKGRR